MHEIIQIPDKGKRTELKGEINRPTKTVTDFNIIMSVSERKKQTHLK